MGTYNKIYKAWLRTIGTHVNRTQFTVTKNTITKWPICRPTV